MIPAETAYCFDCYTVMFVEEMNQCPEGHYTCPGCLCDCSALSHAHVDVPAWLQPLSEA